MNIVEFSELVGKDILVDYPFCGELQTWNMKHFYFDSDGYIKHDYLPIIISRFAENARNPHVPLCGETATHGGA